MEEVHAKPEKTSVAPCIAITMLVAIACMLVTIDVQHSLRNYVTEFNQYVPEHLNQSSVSDILSLTPDISYWSGIKAQDAAFLWTFADKYNISQFPNIRKDTSRTHATHQDTLDFINRLRETDEYITANRIPIDLAANTMQTAIATQTADFLTVIKNN